MRLKSIRGLKTLGALRLSQGVALLKGAKSRGHQATTDLYHRFQNEGYWKGLYRQYQANATEVDPSPALKVVDDTPAQLNVPEELNSLRVSWERMVDMVLTVDAGNAKATANVTLRGSATPILNEIPITTLIFLEKELVNLRSMVSAMPVLSPTEKWDNDDDPRFHRTALRSSDRTSKQPINHVLAPATDHHPAQVQVLQSDVVIGTYATQHISGAVTIAQRRACLARIESLLEAVKIAREEGNTKEIADQHQAAAIFNHVFGDMMD
jgi:hypothetical protein